MHFMRAFLVYCNAAEIGTGYRAGIGLFSERSLDADISWPRASFMNSSDFCGPQGEVAAPRTDQVARMSLPSCEFNRLCGQPEDPLTRKGKETPYAES
jgi:hypothetical protein